MPSKTISRRKFLTLAGVGLGTGLGVAACAPANLVTPVVIPTFTPDPHAGMATPAPVATDMDAMHAAGLKTFVDGIGADPTFWRTPMTPTLAADGFKVFELTCTEGTWAVTPDQSVPAMLYNGVVPGPEIRVTEGDKVRVICHNQMTQSTSIHFHGVRAPNAMDGVPYLTQDPIRPGESFTYEYTVINPGSHMYHSHHNAAEQVTKGLMGAFIIEPKDKRVDPAVDADYVMILNDAGIGLTINGRGFPYTQPIVAKLGQTIRVRYMNEGLMIHPMHLHGMPQSVFARDGYKLPAPFLCDTLSVAPGERWDVTVLCDDPGLWAYHCHILTHAESNHGMFGMVTALVVQA